MWIEWDGVYEYVDNYWLWLKIDLVVWRDAMLQHEPLFNSIANVDRLKLRFLWFPDFIIVGNFKELQKWLHSWLLSNPWWFLGRFPLAKMYPRSLYLHSIKMSSLGNKLEFEPAAHTCLLQSEDLSGVKSCLQLQLVTWREKAQLYHLPW